MPEHHTFGGRAHPSIQLQVMLLLGANQLDLFNHSCHYLIPFPFLDLYAHYILSCLVDEEALQMLISVDRSLCLRFLKILGQ